jgi:serine phosphatase RsbU (regulator of sigma subunit)
MPCLEVNEIVPSTRGPAYTPRSQNVCGSVGNGNDLPEETAARPRTARRRTDSYLELLFSRAALPHFRKHLRRSSSYIESSPECYNQCLTASDTTETCVLVHEQEKLDAESLMEKVLRMQINDPLRVGDVDLRTLVSHRTAVQTNDTVESVFATFAKGNVEFIAVLDAARLLGLCSRHQISELLGGRYGFSLWARKPIGGHLSPNEIRVFVATPIGDVLKEVFARGEDAFYDDVLLVDENESFLGLITTQTLFKVQNALLRTNIRDLVEKEREIQAKNEQTQMDLRMAMELQQALMPVTYPLFPAAATVETARLRFSHVYLPASLISGDFFFIARVSDSCAGIFICDVMGHGVRSALITSMLRALIEGLGPEAADPGQLMTRLNTELTNILKQTGTVLFVTALYCTLDSETGQLRFARAGHPNPLQIRSENNQVEVLSGQSDRSGPALGLLPRAHYNTTATFLSPGDRILLFTDGLIEAEDGDGRQFGMDGLTTSLRGNLDRDNHLLASIENDVRSFAGSNDFKDDVCLVMVQWYPTR